MPESSGTNPLYAWAMFNCPHCGASDTAEVGASVPLVDLTTILPHWCRFCDADISEVAKTAMLKAVEEARSIGRKIEVIG